MKVKRHYRWVIVIIILAFFLFEPGAIWRIAKLTFTFSTAKKHQPLPESLIKNYPKVRKNTTTNQPLTEAYILQWAEHVAVTSLTVEGKNLTPFLQSQSQYYTPTAWQHYLRLFWRDNYHQFKQYDFSLQANVLDTPIIIWRGKLNGRPSMRVSVALNIEYQAKPRSAHQAMVLLLLIQQAHNGYGSGGLVVAQLMPVYTNNVKKVGYLPMEGTMEQGGSQGR